MKSLTREDVTAVLGAVDDGTMVEILGTGATVEELTEARAWVSNDEALINAGRPLASGRIGRLVEILDSLDEGEDGEPRPAGHPAWGTD
jgi:hypothetical protein